MKTWLVDYMKLSPTGFWRLSVSSIQIMCCLALRSSRVCCCLQFHIIKEPLILSSQWDIFFQEVHLLQFFNSERNLFAWIPFSPCIAAKKHSERSVSILFKFRQCVENLTHFGFSYQSFAAKDYTCALSKTATVSRGGYSLTRATHLKERRQ